MLRWAVVKQTAVVAHWIRVFLLLRVPIHTDNVVVIDESGWKKSEVCDLSCIVACSRGRCDDDCVLCRLTDPVATPREGRGRPRRVP